MVSKRKLLFFLSKLEKLGLFNIYTIPGNMILKFCILVYFSLLKVIVKSEFVNSIKFLFTAI